MSVPAVRADALSTPEGAETMISSCTSPWRNFSERTWVALADSDVGSWNPLADRLLATGTPKMARTAVNSAATAMTRRGAAIASCATRCSRSVLHPRWTVILAV